MLSQLSQTNLSKCYHRFSSNKDHQLLNPLFIGLCSTDEKVRWHSVESFGWLVPRIAENDLESARIVMRRFLWSLNDESGGIGWGVPEAMAEVMCYSMQLRKEYLHMLISYMREDGDQLFEDGNYLELPLLQRGLLWGIGRLCQAHQQEMEERGIIENLRAYLRATDLYVVGLALWCLGLLGDRQGLEKAHLLSSCHDRLRLYMDGRFRNISVAELYQEAKDIASDR